MPTFSVDIGKVLNMKVLDKNKQPTKSDIEAANKAFDKSQSGSGQKFAAFGSIDTTKEGVEVGLMNTVKYHFERHGDRLVGYLKCRKRIEMKDSFMVYEVYNTKGDWSFSGGQLVEGRMEEVPDCCIVDITYTEDKMSTQTQRLYKVFRIKFYPWPDGVDPCGVRVGLSEDGKMIEAVDFPSDLGATPKIEDEQEAVKE